MTKCSVLAFQHTETEPLGYLEELLREWDVPFSYHRCFDDDRVDRGDASHLVFLGGPMSVNDEREFPFLKAEKDLIRQSVKKGIPVLGLCLGAQLIASAFHAPVYRFVNEMGWFVVDRVPADDLTFNDFPGSFPVFQFHSETFGLPYRGRLLCSGDRVRHQAFRYRSALALQFHLEMTSPLIEDWCRELSRAKRDRIRNDTARFIAGSNRLCLVLFRHFLGLPRQRT